LTSRRCAASLSGGSDISKDTLDAFWLSKRQHKQFSNTKAGLKKLILWVQQATVFFVVFEATGVYHRLLETSLAAHEFFARVNRRQARRFGEGAGSLAKTDRVDVAMLAREGSTGVESR
jgi:transposase